MPYFTCELTRLNKIAFAVADDPFYKPTRSKYYPECILYNKKGNIKAVINPQNRQFHKHGIEFLEDFREP